MQDIIINWRSTTKSVQVNKQAKSLLQNLRTVAAEASQTQEVSVIDQIKAEAVKLAASLPENSIEAAAYLRANSAKVQAIYARVANVSDDAARTMANLMNEALGGKHTVAIVEARSKYAPAIAWKNNVDCFMIVDPTYLHKDGKGGFLALSA